MKLVVIILLIFGTYTTCQEGVTSVPEEDGTVGDFMDDFPLDETGSGEGGLSDGIEDTTQIDPFMDLNEEDFESEENKQELLKKVMTAAMARPGARQRLAQVMPILRTMSAPQRLALAALVTSQLMSPPGVTPPPLNMTKDNMTQELMIPISMDIAAMFRGLGREAGSARSSLYRNEVNRLKYPPSYRRRPILNSNRRTTNVALDMLPPPPPKTNNHRIKPPRPHPKIHANRFPPLLKKPQDQDLQPEDCEFFSTSLCLDVTDYPLEAILKSIQSTPNKNSFEALRVDSKQNVSEIMPAEMQMERRQGDLRPEDNGPMCSSKVEIARPKRARATSGQWKYIVNTADYTQTLRLEICLKPKQSCSYLADTFKSECTQVYNYHRLMTWDQQTGLTMDIFKVPTCCSCHVQGYSYAFMQGSGGDPTKRHTAESVQMHPQLVTRPPHPYLESAESNFVADEPPIHRQPPPKLIIGRRPGSLLNLPKRESFNKRPGTIQHRGPPLQLHDLEPSNPRYPPYDNMVRRTLSRPNITELTDERPDYSLIRPTPNQRHPQLPADSINENSGFAVATPPPTTNTVPNKRNTYTYQTTPQTPQTPSKRVNYSYHPIIDFFKTSASAGNIAERMDQDEWRPITDGPRLMPK